MVTWLVSVKEVQLPYCMIEDLHRHISINSIFYKLIGGCCHGAGFGG